MHINDNIDFDKGSTLWFKTELTITNLYNTKRSYKMTTKYIY